MNEYDLYLFDFDNTLFDTSYGISQILKSSLSAIGIKYSDNMFIELLGLNMDQIFKKCVGDKEKYITFRDAFLGAAQTDVYKSAVPFPDVKYTLVNLMKHKKHIGIVSGKLRFKIIYLLKQYNMLDYVETIVGFDDTKIHKPYSDPIKLAMSRFDVSGDMTVYVGDSPVDYEAAKSAGIDVIIVNRHNDSIINRIPCNFIVSTLKDILNW